MCSAQVSPSDQAAGLSAPPWRVVVVQACEGYRLDVRFADGTRGEVDLSTLITRDDAGVFASLRDTTRFAKVAVVHGAPAWPGDVDLAPDALYAAIRAHGHCAL